MVKKFNMFALIVLLVFQTMIAPIAATAQTIEQEDVNTETLEDLDSTEEADVSDENEGSENEDTDANEEELAGENSSEGEDSTNEDASKENSEAGEDSEEPVTDDADEEEEIDVNEEESVTEESQEDVEVTSDNEVEKDTPKKQAIEPYAEITHNIFEFEYFRINEVDVEEGSEIGFDDTYQLQYQWHTEGLGVVPGDTARLILPDVFKKLPAGAIPPQPVLADGADGNKVEVGKYTIENGELIFTFDENILDGSVQNGVVGFNVNFDKEKFLEEWEQDIDFDGNGTKDLTVVAKPEEVETKLDKDGQPDQYQNAREITWSVDITNGSENAITNGVLSDILPKGVGEPVNFVVREFSYDFEGNKIPGGEVGFNEPTITDEGFKLEFDTVPARGGYTVEYTTTIIDNDIRVFKNDATFTAEGVNLDVEETVQIGERSNPIQKSGTYNWGTGQIDWTIIVNENGMDIGNAIVNDDLPEEQTLVPGTIKVTNNWQDTDIEATGFPITLGPVSSNDVYRINFSTDIDWTEVNDGQYTRDNAFTNKTNLTDGEDPIGENEHKVDVQRENLLSKWGSNHEYSYDDKVLSWTIDVNKAKHPIDDAVLTDTIPAGLNISKDDIKFEGADISPDNITIIRNDDGTQTVVINLGNIADEVKVSYTTEVEDFEKNDFKNEASLEGEGIGVGTPEAEGGATVNPPRNSFTKDFKGIDYSEKTIDWELSVNPQREAITELKIEDTFPNNGMILLPETISVKIGGTELEKGTDYTLVPNTDGGETGYNKGFTIDLINISEDSPLNEVLTVDFKTSYDPQKEVDGNIADDHTGDPTLYTNHANFTGKTVNDFDRNDDAETRVREDSWNSGKKEGQLVYVDGEDLEEGWVSGSERKVAWQLYTNYQKQNLGTGVVITDKLAYEGTIDEDSVKVFVYNVKQNGDTEITDEELSTDKYVFTVDGKELTLTFNDTVSERYVVTYTTTVPDISEKEYKNDVIVKVGDKDYPYFGTVNYDKYDSYLDKEALGHEGAEVFIGEELEWEVTVNENLSVIKEAIITDTISAGLAYVEGSLTITTGSGTELVEVEDYTLTVTPTDEGKTILEIEFTNDLTEELTLNYKTVVVAEDGIEVNNKVDLNGTEVTNESETSDSLTAKQFSWVGGNYSPSRGVIEIEKVDADGNRITTDAATFALYFEMNDERILVGEYSTQGGTLEIPNLPLRTYYLVEVVAPDGYVLTNEEIEVVVDKPYGPDQIVFDVPVTNYKEGEEPEPVEVSVEKVWEDADNQDGIRSESITVNLLANGEVETSEDLNEENNWSHVFTDLSAVDEDGNDIEYTVEEVAVEGYETTISGTSADGFVITNSYTPEQINLNGTKTWEDADNQDGARPDSITVNLLANGTEVDSAEVTAETDWTFEFTDLPKFENGEEINYTVQEDEVEDYSTEIDGTNITNSYTPGQTSVNVVKAWRDADNQDGIRPASITVKLLADGEETDREVELNEGNNWQADFAELDVYAAGEEITYTIEEVAVEGYETSISGTSADGFVITNSYTPELIDVDGNKTWDDADNQDGARPDSITVNLLANGNEIDSIDVTEATDWTFEFTDLPKFEDGEEITYTVQEDDVEEYSTKIDGFDITNSYTPGQTSINVVKAWEDANNQDGIRSDSITVKLLADGEETDKQVILNEANNWQADFAELDVYAAGEEITYTIEEVAVEGYETSISGSSNDGFVITNSYTPELIDVDGNKTWDDADNQDGARPDSITVNLLANGTEVDSAEVTAETDWTFEFTDLPKFENGEEITYTVQEDEVKDYSTVIDGFNITNGYTPGQTSINVVKSWEDANNQDGIRPASITVKLLADGEETDREVELNEGNNWQADFAELDVYAAGEEITYTIEEVAVEGYETSISGTSADGFVITNTYEPELIDLDGTKTWDDADNQDGARPDSITVNLLANGNEIDSIDVTGATDWTFEFTDLPKFENGEEINYTVQEDAVEDYSTVIDGFSITNSYTPGQTSINVMKAWEDANNQDGIRSDSITVKLLADGEETGQERELSEDNNWQADFTELDVNKDGKTIVYTVEEVAVDEYRTEITGDSETGFVITNTLKTYAIGDYTWIDSNKDGIQDEDEEVLEGVIVELYDESGENKLAETTTDENGLYIFDELPAGKYTVKFTLTDEQKEKYVFTKQNADENSTKDSDADPETGWTTVIELDDANEHLTKDYKDQGFKATEGIDPTWDAGVIEKTPITPIEPAKTKVSVEKVWIGEAQDEVTINLLADGEKVDSVELSEENDWKHTFTDLSTVHEITDEKAIEYTVEEVKVDGYNTEVTGDAKDGFTITNTEKTYAIGDYTWIDSNKDGIQDEDEEVLPGVKVELFDEDGEKVAETKTDKNGLYIFDELPAGKYKVKFTLTEEQAKKYEFTKQNAGDDSTVDSDADENGWTIEFTLDDTNEHLTKDYKDQSFKATEGIDPTWDAGVIEKTPITPIEPAQTKVSVEKVWIGEAQEKVTINLLADGEKVDSVELSEENDWKHTFTDLPTVHEDTDEKAIAYTVEEVEINGYLSEITGDIKEGFTITNTQEVIEITGTKTWKDDDAVDRPVSITVQVMNADEVVQEQEVTAEDDWNFTFTDLAKYDTEDNQIEYTINELPVPGYATEINGFDITNTRADVLDIAGTKTWKDDNVEDRPVSITVQLLANGEVVDSIKVTGETDWTYVFENQDGYDAAGVAILYTVAEVEVDGYETSINGFDITNTLVPVEEDPEDPTDPEEPGKPVSGDKDPEDPKVEESDGDKLPKTATAIYNLAFIGFGLMLLGLILFLVRRKRVE